MWLVFRRYGHICMSVVMIMCDMQVAARKSLPLIVPVYPTLRRLMRVEQLRKDREAAQREVVSG